jgi:hypothetical protein
MKILDTDKLYYLCRSPRMQTVIQKISVHEIYRSP